MSKRFRITDTTDPRSGIEYFSTESEACDRVYRLMRSGDVNAAFLWDERVARWAVSAVGFSGF